MSRFTSIACMLALVLVSCGAMFAQAGALDVYQVTYYDNNWGNGAPLDAGTIRIINPGLTGSPVSPTQGTLCANIYVFDDTQEMIECCSCPVTANGLLTISVQDLTENPLSDPVPQRDQCFDDPEPDLRPDHQCRRDSGSARFLDAPPERDVRWQQSRVSVHAVRDGRRIRRCSSERGGIG